MTIKLDKQLRSQRELWQAWSHVRENGLKSRSEETRSEVKDFNPRAPGKIRYIQDKLRDNRYSFAVPHAILIQRDGKPPRPILKSPIEDRIVQRALLCLLQEQAPVANLIAGASAYGAIPGRGVRPAIEAAMDAIRSGASHFIRSDISGFFQHIPRQKVTARLNTLIKDTSLSPVLEAASMVDKDLLDDDQVGSYRDLFPSPEEGVAHRAVPLSGVITSASS